MQLSMKSAIVTGAGGGIGRSTALKLSDHGASVVVADINLAAAEKTVSLIRERGHNAIAIETDVTDRNQVIKMNKASLREYKQIDILVNNAGILSKAMSIEDLTDEQWDRVFDVDLKGTLICSQVVGKEMIKRRSGNIINIASTCGHGPYPMQAAYSVAKAAVILLTQQLSVEWAEYNIRVNAISPGLIRTSLTEHLYSDPEIYKARCQFIPLHRVGKPEDIAEVALFLASDSSSYITGIDIVVDGGLLNVFQKLIPGTAGVKKRG